MVIGIDGNSLTRNLTGVGVYTYDMIRYFLSMEDENEYYVFVHKAPVVDFDNNTRLHIINSNSASVVLWYLLILPIEIKKVKLDLFWEPGNRLPIIPNKNVKLCVTVHDLASYIFPQYCSWKSAVMEKLFLHNTCRKASGIIAISNSTRKDILKLFDKCEDKVEVIYDGDSPYSSEKEYDEMEKNKILVQHKISMKYFLFVGSLSPRKNIITIVKAYEQIRNEGYQYQLVLAGKMAWKSNGIKKTIDKSRYKNDIIVTGYVSEIEKEYLYKYTEALLYPSIYEGFGFPIVEAMSIGTRVITSNNSSLPEIAEDAALYLDNIFDYEELACLMKQMIDMPNEERAIMKEKGVKRSSLFSRKDTAMDTLDLFHRIGNE